MFVLSERDSEGKICVLRRRETVKVKQVFVLLQRETVKVRYVCVVTGRDSKG